DALDEQVDDDAVIAAGIGYREQDVAGVPEADCVDPAAAVDYVIAAARLEQVVAAIAVEIVVGRGDSIGRAERPDPVGIVVAVERVAEIASRDIFDVDDG